MARLTIELGSCEPGLIVLDEGGATYEAETFGCTRWDNTENGFFAPLDLTLPEVNPVSVASALRTSCATRLA
jgi:hypothetical protein